MKHILLTTIAAVLVVGCGPSMSIHDASAVGDIEAVKQHIAAGMDMDGKNENGMTPLFGAAFNGHKEVAELLIAAGADVNAKGFQGTTPLHSAAGKGRKEIVELLIAKGADVNAKGDGGITPLDIAADPSNPNVSTETADLLRKHGGKTGEELKAEGK